MGGFPLDVRVLHIGEHETGLLIHELHVLEIGAACVVVYVVVTRLVVAEGDFHVVDELDVEPLLGRNQPSSLYGGEHTPGDAAHVEAALGVLTETRGRFHRNAGVDEVLVGEIVTGVEVVSEVLPLVVHAAIAEIVKATRNVRHLVVLVVIARNAAGIVGIRGEAETAEEVNIVLLIAALPADVDVIEEGCFLTYLRSDEAGSITHVGHVLDRRTVCGEVVLLVVAVHDVAEAVLNGEVLVDAVLRCDVHRELHLLLIVLVVAFTVLKNPERIDETTVTERLGKAEGVVAVRIVLTGIYATRHEVERVVVVANIVGVRTKDRCLQLSEHVGRRDVAAGVVGRPTVIAQVV